MLAAGTSTTGWVVGYTIGIVIVLVVVALVRADPGAGPPIGNEAPKINDALTEAVHNTAPLGALRTTIEHAATIIGGLQRGRARLGGYDAMPVAMSSTEHNLWLTANILGLVVVVAVAALLSLLIWLREDHRPPGGAGAGHAQGRGGEHRGHRADPAGRRRRGAVLAEGLSTTCSSAACSER